MIHLRAALDLLANPSVGTPEQPAARARWTHGDRWDVEGTRVEYLGHGKFSVGGHTVHDENLGAALEYRFRWDPGVLAAVDHLAQGV